MFWTNKSLEYSVIEILDNDEIEEKIYIIPNKVYENDDWNNTI